MFHYVNYSKLCIGHIPFLDGVGLSRQLLLLSPGPTVIFGAENMEIFSIGSLLFLPLAPRIKMDENEKMT